MQAIFQGRNVKREVKSEWNISFDECFSPSSTPGGGGVWELRYAPTGIPHASELPRILHLSKVPPETKEAVSELSSRVS